MIMKKRFIKTLAALGVATMLTMLFAACDANKDIEGTTKINGAVVEKPERQPFKMPTLEEMMATFGSGGPGGRGGEEGRSGGPPGGPPGMGSDEGSIPAVYIDNGKYAAAKSKTDVVTAGEIKDAYASGVKVTAEGGGIGGVYVKGIGSEYLLSDANIELSGDGTGREGGMSTGAASTDHGTLILKNVNITTNGKSRCATAATKYSTLKVYNSTLTAHGSSSEQPSATPITTGGVTRPFTGSARTHCTMSNSYSYFYYSTIIADGWGALSTDGAEGFVYLEANNCKIQTTKSGYGTYADGACHNYFNHCEFDVASMAAIVAGEADITFSDTKVKSGGNFVMIHCVMGQPAEVSTVKVNGGEISCKDTGILVKSQNAILRFDGVKMASESGVLVKSVVNDDPNATKTNGQKVYGIHATFRDMEVAGDIVDEDTDRDMWVYLESTTTLTGAIKDAYITIDSSSKWIATADSMVTIIGSVELTQIDAPAGVTINAVGGQEGTFTLKSGGTLILKIA